jgi:hypothetical protein
MKAIIALLFINLTGCTDQSHFQCALDCGSSIVLTARASDAHGAPKITIEGTRSTAGLVENVTGFCATGAEHTSHCNLGVGPGTYRYKVIAEHYQSLELETVVAAGVGECNCGYTTSIVEVTLQALN